MKTVFFGAVEGSRLALKAMCKASHCPELVVTLGPDRAASHSDYADLGPICAAYGVALLAMARHGKAEVFGAVQALQPDLIVVIGWSQLLDHDMRDVPRLGCLGFHPAPLPRMRGRGVIPWQILTGAVQGGATLFWLAEGADTGDIAAQSLFAIDPGQETARSLYDKAVAEMIRLLPPLLDRIAQGERPATPQDHRQATLCARRDPKDGLIDWQSPAAQIERLIRAVGPPYPCAFTHDALGQVLTIRTARINARDGYYIGMPGQVQAVSQGTVTIMCGDGHCLDLLDFDGPRPSLHSRLGRGPGWS